MLTGILYPTSGHIEVLGLNPSIQRKALSVKFLDEPTIGLDVVVKQKIRELILKLNKEEKTTIFLTSHDAGDIEQLCKRAIIINHEVIVFNESIKSLKRNYLNKKIIHTGLKKTVLFSGFIQSLYLP